MKKTNNIIVREIYGLFCENKEQVLKCKDELRVENSTPFNSPVSGEHWMQTDPIVKICHYLKMLWKGYLERKAYRNEVQGRLLKQRALKRERESSPLSQTGEGHWTERFLRLKAESFTLILRCYNSMLGSRNEFGMTNQELEVTNWTLEMTKLRSRNVFGMTKLGFGVIKLGLEMTNWSYGMTKRSFAMVALLLLMVSLGATAQDTIRPLKIGDSVPDFTLEKVSNYSGNTLKLSDLKGKLVILDFWATWCSPCVASIPRLDSLQQIYKDQLQVVTVTYESSAEITKFNKQLLKRGIKNTLVQITDDQVLHVLFPHHELPHEVWISPTGKVMAFTQIMDVTGVNINKALRQELSVKIKVDHQIKDDMNKPLFVNGIGGDGASLIYHRVFSPYVQGLKLRSVSWAKPDGSTRIRATNTNLSRLYQVAFSSGGIDFTGKNRLKIIVKDTTELIAPQERVAMLAWISKNTYCYELMAPANFNGKGYEEMKKDLSILFPQYIAGIEKQEVDCWVLQRTSSIDKMATKGGKELRDFNPIHFEIQNQPLRQLAGMLDIKYLSLQPFPVLDETGYKGKVDLVLDASMSRVSSINDALKAYDLALVKAKRTIDLLVIRDSDVK